MKRAILSALLLASLVSAQQIKINPETGLLDLVGSTSSSGSGSTSAPYPVTMAGSDRTINYSTHLIPGDVGVICFDASGVMSSVPVTIAATGANFNVTIYATADAFSGTCKIFPLGVSGAAVAGDVVGPASSTNGNIVTMNGTTGKLIQDSGTALSAVATLTGTQTFTDKTLIAPVIASFAAATHNHTNSAGGAQLTDAALSAAVTVAKGGTGLTGGTSGGVPYYSSASAIASSAALGANLPVVGGGAGAAPTTGTRSGNTTAFVTTTGTQTLGRCVEIDANGNHIAAAGPCVNTAVPVCSKYTVAETALTDADTSQDIALFTLPARGKITGVTIKQSDNFTGGSISALTVSVGTTASPAAYSAAFDIFQAEGDTVMQDDGGHFSTTFVSHSVIAQFNSTGGNVSAATQGSVDIWACYAVLP